MAVTVNSKSATAMLAINRFVTLMTGDFFKTTNKPKELPNKATMKITAYADVMPIFTFVEIAAMVEFRP
jgi:hypothetical protein